MNDPPEHLRALAALLERTFFARTDRVAILAPWGKPQPAEPLDEPNEPGSGLSALLSAHVAGEGQARAKVRYQTRQGNTAASGAFRVGSYVPAADGTTPWLCLDFDGGDEHADALEDPLAAARAAMDRCAEFELPCYLERSGGGAGWHVWVFFEPGVKAKDARTIGFALAPTDLRCRNGNPADARSARGVEVFPKQSQARRRGFGNMVWLPFWSGAAPGGNRFCRIEDNEPVEYAPEGFERVTPARVAELVDSLPPQANPSPTAPAGATQDTTDDRRRAWKTWRKEAIAKLPLEPIYGKWLTGSRSGEGWLECRDPGSPTGDRSPSAGVADGTGKAERGSFHSHRTGKTISVFDFLVRHGKAAGMKEAAAIVARHAGVSLPSTKASALRTSGRSQSSRRRNLPEIQTNNRQTLDIVEDAWVAIHKWNRPPKVFRRTLEIVRINENKFGPFIEELGEPGIHGVLLRSAIWLRFTEDDAFHSDPTAAVARDMLVNVDPGLPDLDAVVTTPVFARNGTLINQAGYHRSAHLYFQPKESRMLLDVSDTPTTADIAKARALICDELLVDFPFVSPADRANAVAALILPFVRRLIDGPTPLHLIEAPTPGTGKSLLAEVIAAVATGQGTQPMTLGRDDAENGKKITAALSRSQQVMIIDNVRHGLDSSNLAQVLTTTRYQDRILGQTKMIDLPNEALWIATANNPNLSLEIARRSIRIRLDSMTDRPWEGRAFKHERLPVWTALNRPQLVHAVLTLASAWITAGRPAGSRTLGSFESWSETIGGILDVAGVESFLGNLDELYEMADQVSQEWRAFVAAWDEEHGGESVTAGTLVDLAVRRELLGSVIGDKSARSQAIRIGKALMGNRDRQYDRWRIVCSRSGKQKQQLWRLVPVAGDEPLRPPLGHGDVTSSNDRRDVGPKRRDVGGMFPDDIPPKNTNAGNSLEQKRDVAGSEALPNAHARERRTHEGLAHAHVGGNRAELHATSRQSIQQTTTIDVSERDVVDEHPANYPPTSRQASDEPEAVDLTDFDDQDDES